ncbi:MAG: TldD/PmbA family protein [Rhodomicrobium sp.]
MLLAPDEVKAITAKIISRSGAEACTVSVRGGNTTNFRFARNEATTNGAVSEVGVSIKSCFGKRSGSASVDSLDEAALEEARVRSEVIARLSPENPEFMPLLGPQTYEPEGARFDFATAHVHAAGLAHAAKAAIAEGRGREVDIAGYIEAGSGFRALANSAGLFAYDRGTSAELTVTARDRLRSWSGWAGASQNRFLALDSVELGERAVKKALFKGEPADLDPGIYTVILEPAAVADLVVHLIGSMGARPAEEGRSFLAKPGGGTKLGEQLLSAAVSITSDPADAHAPGTLYGEDGLPKRRTVWFERGVAKNASCSRFWAQKTGREPLPQPSSFCMEGGEVSLEEMIREVKRGILVTRLWYVNTVDPRTLLCTGMTRDGNFLIENGRITRPALNLRFNESPVSALNKIEAIGPARRATGSNSFRHAISVPPLLISGFTFSSKSSGI